jgi:DNA-binding transcriptional LysR family regulator
MRVFSKVVETENFAEAARRLKLSPPMVTRHIQSLERRLGTRLINRTTHQFSLTEAGANYHARCARLLADIEEAEEAVGSMSQLPRGRLRVTAPLDFGRVELWPIIREFMRRYPEIHIDLVLTNRVVDLIEEEVDLAIRMAEGALDGPFIVRKLATSRHVVCASPAYLRRHGVPQTPDDLLAHKCLIYGTAGRHEGWEFSRQGRSQRIKVVGCLQSNQVGLLCQAAVEGTGIVMQPTLSVWEHLATGRLRTLLDDWSAGGLGVFIAFQSRRFLPVKTRLFIDFVVGIFRNDPDRDVWIERAQARSLPPSLGRKSGHKARPAPSRSRESNSR